MKRKHYPLMRRRTVQRVVAETREEMRETIMEALQYADKIILAPNGYFHKTHFEGPVVVFGNGVLVSGCYLEGGTKDRPALKIS